MLTQISMADILVGHPALRVRSHVWQCRIQVIDCFTKRCTTTPLHKSIPSVADPFFSSKSEPNKKTLCESLTDSAYKKLEQSLHRDCWLKTRPVSSFSSGIHIMIKQFYRCESFFPQNRTKLLCNVENLLLSVFIYYSTA